MLLLGPNWVSAGLTRSTGFLVSRGPAMLGPCDPDEGSVMDPLARIFLITGKLMAIRRIAGSDHPNQDPDYITQWEKVAMGLVDQGVYGEAEDWLAYTEAWEPVAHEQVPRVVDSLRHLVQQVDQSFEVMVQIETANLFGLERAGPWSEKIAAILQRMRDRGLSVQDSPDGMGHYFTQRSQAIDGQSLDLPASLSPTFPDRWITPEVIYFSNPRPQTWVFVL